MHRFIRTSLLFKSVVLILILLATVAFLDGFLDSRNAAADSHGRRLCDRVTNAGIRGGGGEIRDKRRCPGGRSSFDQSDYWGWHCLQHGRYVANVTFVEYRSATHGEFVNEHPINLAVNLTPEQLGAYVTLTYQRRSCLRFGATLSTIVYPVDSDGTSLDELIASARARVEPPIPSITRLPSYDDGHAVVVQTPLWVWTTDPVTETASDGNTLRVSVTSHLQSISFELAGSDYSNQWTCDPSRVQVSGEGLSGEQYLQPDDFGACHTIVEHSSTGEPNNTFTLTATATWTFTYTINGSAPLPIPGTVVRTNTYPVDAVEILIIETDETDGDN